MKKGQKYKEGDVFGQITLIEMVKRDSPRSNRKRSGWLGRCSCGDISWYEVTNLTSGNTKRCEKCSKKNKGKGRLTHGGTSKSSNKEKRRLYTIWRAMKSRCSNPKNKCYERYGGRGIRVCARWENSFEAFMEDMGFPEEGQSIDRIDNFGDYEPGNCRWSDRFEQANNKRNNVTGEYQGKKISIAEAAKIAGVEYDFIKQRLQKGFTMKQAIEIEKGKRRKSFTYFVDGESFPTLQEIANKYNMAISAIANRIHSEAFPNWTRKEQIL